MDHSKLVSVQAFGSQAEADLAKRMLESAGIDAMIQADRAGGLAHHPPRLAKCLTSSRPGSPRIDKRKENAKSQTAPLPICADANRADDDPVWTPTARRTKSLRAAINNGESPTAGIMRNVSIPTFSAS